jgi:hypothetical protein
MRQYPSNEKDDQQNLAMLNAETWQIELLKLNPSYLWWGCYEDYMSDDNKGWSSRTIMENWDECKNWDLDELNELVNFYFEVYRKSEPCEDKAKVALQLWYINPRKGCSRGAYIKEIKEDEIPQVIDYLNNARERNEHRFSGLDKFNT